MGIYPPPKLGHLCRGDVTDGSISTGTGRAVNPAASASPHKAIGNLLGREVTADDVAQAFLAQTLALKTTADVTTVDGDIVRRFMLQRQARLSSIKTFA